MSDKGLPDFANMMRNMERQLAPPKFELPRLQLPEMKLKELSMAEMKAMSSDDLLAFLLGEDGQEGIVPVPMQQAIRAELAIRAARPHWSQTKGFWVGAAALVVAILALIVAALAYWRPRPAALDTSPRASEAVAQPAQSGTKNPGPGPESTQKVLGAKPEQAASQPAPTKQPAQKP